MRNIPKKNYIAFILLCIGTLLLTFILINQLSSFNDSKENLNSKYFYQIGNKNVLENLQNYSLDNPNFILYISFKEDEKFEKELSQYIADISLNNKIVYLKAGNDFNSNFISNFSSKFFSSTVSYSNYDFMEQSNMYKFENSKITNNLYSAKKKINIDDARLFIERNGEFIND